MITLFIEPRVVKTWNEFLAQNPPYSIALDGYVRGRPEFDCKGPHANYNHHEEVSRLGTRATCAQVHIAIKQGLFDTFRKDGQAHANVYVNDPDQDTSLAVWLLQNHHRLNRTRSEPLINRIVQIEDLIDTTAGAYPMELASPVMESLAWIFEPYTDARMHGRIPRMGAWEMRNIIELVGRRISDYTVGRGSRIPLDTRYDLLGGGRGWSMIHEKGPYARSELFLQGTKAFVSAADNKDGTFTYSIGKMSPFIPKELFPSLLDIYSTLNKEERLQDGAANSWGGGETSGGSPRMTGSRLPPKEIERIIRGLIAPQGGAP